MLDPPVAQVVRGLSFSSASSHEQPTEDEKEEWQRLCSSYVFGLVEV